MEIDILSAVERDKITNDYLRSYLAPLGFAEAQNRKWIDGSCAPVRRIFSMELLKGAGMKACWGFSLDFVPHLSGGKLRWHRSDKTALLDVFVDPRDLQQPSFLKGSQFLKQGLARLLPEAISRAQETWRKGETYEGMLEVVQEIRDKKTNCFGFDNYSQLPLAFAFLLARSGNKSFAEQELERYSQIHRLSDETTTRLKSATEIN